MNCDTWPTPDTGCVAGCDIPEDTEETVLEAAATQAGVILRTLAGGRVGTCETTLRPIPECGGCSVGCAGCCGAGDRVYLASSAGPVTSVQSVTIDGSLVDPAGWRFYPSSQLLYRVPPDVWPRLDRKWADCDEDETMCVEVTIGYEPDAWALAVHAELTCELVKACLNVKCRIPKNATQVTGQGVTVSLTPVELKQFIPAVAGWVAAVNPDSAQSPGRVFSPDANRRNGSGSGSGFSGPGDIDGGWA